MNRYLWIFAGLGLGAAVLLTACDSEEDSGSGSDNNGTNNGTNGGTVITVKIDSVRVGLPLCATGGAGGVDGATFAGNRGYVDVYPSCTASNAAMRVWLQVNVPQTNIAYYDWTLAGGTNVPHGVFDSSDILSTNSTSSGYVVRTAGSKIRYASTGTSNLLSLSQTLKEQIAVTVWSTQSNFANAYFQINLLAAPKTNVGLLISEGFRPHLSPDATRLVFCRLSDYSSAPQSQVWIVNTNGSGLKQLTGTAGFSDYSPQWTPDGQSIVLVRKTGAYNTNALGALYRVQPDGTGLQAVSGYSLIKDFCLFATATGTSVVADYNNSGLWFSLTPWPGGPNWSQGSPTAGAPRSQAELGTGATNVVMFDPTQTGVRGLTVVNVLLGIPNLLNNSGRFPWPCLSPLGRKIIAGAAGGVANGIWDMDIYGNGLTQRIASPTGASDHQPTWSKNVVFFVHTTTGSALEHGDLYLWRGATE